VPKILLYVNPGVGITEQDVAWCRENMANLKTVDIGDGLHFIQEDNPELIGRELSAWYPSL
jgi:haloalkane dehalogenase